ncbi:MAG: hypothetical protein ACP5JH_02410 [Bacteroidota bacterium]
MNQVLTIFAENLLAITIVFVVLFLAIGYLFAREKFTQMLLGILLTIASLFYSPFLYLRNAFLELAEYGAKGESEFVKTKQYLLNKFLFSLQALLVVGSIVSLASGFVSSWNQMLPPKPLRESISQLKDQLRKERPELAEINPRVSQMETAWATQKGALVNSYNGEREKRAATAAKENEEIERTIRGTDESTRYLFNAVKSSLAWYETYYGNPRVFEDARTSARYSVERSRISDDNKQLLHKYCDNWYLTMLARFDISSLTEAQLRSAVQPEYRTLKNRAQVLPELIARQEQELASLKSEAKYNVPALLLGVVISLVSFIVLIWVIGLIIEALYLLVHLAVDIHKIREQYEPKFAVKP